MISTRSSAPGELSASEAFDLVSWLAVCPPESVVTSFVNRHASSPHPLLDDQENMQTLMCGLGSLDCEEPFDFQVISATHDHPFRVKAEFPSLDPDCGFRDSLNTELSDLLTEWILGLFERKRRGSPLALLTKPLRLRQQGEAPSFRAGRIHMYFHARQ